MSTLTVAISKKLTTVEKSLTTFKLGELFCGPGGLGFGAVQARAETYSSKYQIQHEWATDYDVDSCRTYIRNICPHVPKSVFCQDIKSLNIKILSHVDAFAYGFPCNDFSIVGKQKRIQR